MKVIIDTREKVPLKFGDSAIKEVIFKKLDTGDYCIDGMENVLFIERKSSFMEFYGNLTEDRFWRELDRTVDFKYRFLILQFNLENILDFPYGSGLSKDIVKTLKLTSNFLLKRTMEIITRYNINVIFVGDYDNACRVTERIIKNVYEEESRT